MNPRNSRLPVVLIGSVSRNDTGPIPTVTRAFMEGLAKRYDFVAHRADRRIGSTRLSQFNLANIYYLLKHYVLWVLCLLRRRPDIAHYPVTSYWNLEKSMLFLHTARLLGSASVGHLHGGEFLRFWGTLSGPRKNRALKALRSLDAFVVLSDGWKRDAVREIGLDPSRVWVVNNPIDSEFEKAAITLPMRPNAHSILSLGIMSRQKGVFDILEASRTALAEKGFSLCLAGPDREPGVASQCKEYVAAHGLGSSVSILPAVQGEQKFRLFAASSIFLLPSYVENFPLVILEAAAAGMAIITTRVGATPEFFEHEDSVLYVTPGNIEEIAAAMSRLMSEPATRERLGTRAREVFLARLSRERIMHSLDAVYQDVLPSSKKRTIAYLEEEFIP